MSQQITIRHLVGYDPVFHFLGVLEDGGAGARDGIVQQLRQGEFAGFVPASLTSEQAYRFKKGGILRPQRMQEVDGGRLQEVSPPFDAIAKLVALDIQAYKKPVLWVHEPLMLEDEIKLEGLRYKRIGSKLYLTYDRLGEEQIAEAIRFSMLSWHFLAFLTDGIPPVESVADLLGKAKIVLVGAYDGESALIWERNA